jgi:class 3 adenylate cyclase/tetratricopeptide (TPR) repeat protein
VLCCALAEAPTLAARLGPEAMHYLMRDVLALAQDTVQRYEGTLTQVSGDGFLALFGAPVAQEDHARRGVLAALELCQRLRVPNAIRGQPHGVAVGLGLHTGPVVVGPLAYEPQRPYTAAGDTLHLATRLQQQAAPDTLLVSAATYALVQDEVQGEACETSSLNGPSTLVPVYAIRGLLRRRAGVPRRGARPLSRFVGRTQELALLHERLEQAVGGHGQVIGIAGEPGLGKSRLLAEFVQSLLGWPVTYCEGHCLAYGSATPYLAVRDLLRQLWGLPEPTPATAITTTVYQRLREAGVESEDEALVLLQLLDVPVDLAPLAALDPPMRKARTFAVLSQVIRQASQRQPLLLAVENLHWIDPTSEEWLASLVERLGDVPVVLLVTYRPGYQPPWIRQSVATQMALPRLSPRDSLVVLQSVPQAAQLPAPLQQAIVAKAAGNPFFVEELTLAAVEPSDHACTLPMPDTIEAVLAARIDRLPPEEKRLLQAAAVIGTQVPLPLLQRLAGLPEDVLHRGLAHLQGREFLYETHLFPEHAYTFKHALTREVAYGSLLHERRRALHIKIVDAIETLYAERLGEQVDRLAHHALRGEVWVKAVAYCRQAGEKAMARSAYSEAAGCFEQALSALPHLPEQRDTREQAIDLRLALGSALEPSGDWERILAPLREAEALAAALDDPRRLGQVSVSLSVYFRIMGAYDQAIATTQRALALGTASGEVVLHAQANLSLGYTYQAQGNYRRAIDCYRQAAAFFDGARRHEHFGGVLLPAVLSRAYLATCHAELGMFAEGHALVDEGLRIAEAVAHPGSLMIAYYGIGLLALRQGDLPRALPLLERAMDICQKADLPASFPWIATALGAAYTLCGRVADAVPLLTQAMEQSTAMERVYFERLCGLPLGKVRLLAGRLEEA